MVLFQRRMHLAICPLAAVTVAIRPLRQEISTCVPLRYYESTQTVTASRDMTISLVNCLRGTLLVPSSIGKLAYHCQLHRRDILQRAPRTNRFCSAARTIIFAVPARPIMQDVWWSGPGHEIGMLAVTESAFQPQLYCPIQVAYAHGRSHDQRIKIWTSPHLLLLYIASRGVSHSFAETSRGAFNGMAETFLTLLLLFLNGMLLFTATLR